METKQNDITVSGPCTIKIARLPNKTHKVEVEPGDEIQVVFAKAGLPPLASDEKVSLNGQPATAETQVKSGDFVTAGKDAAGA